MTDSKKDDTITALEYIEQQEQLEKDAKDILPGNFEKCTFNLGYIRQPLYACKTCTTDQNQEPAGMCYSCSIACHASHELFELFPKRNFRCDCGLSEKFGGHPCSRMVPEKSDFARNKDNQYNHNFENLYCRCNQSYNPEKEEDVMFQCIACEDWFHERCIGNIPEAIENFDCYVCRTCTAKYPFLMNGKDARFSYGLSKQDKPIDQWILPEGQHALIDVTNNLPSSTESNTSKVGPLATNTSDETKEEPLVENPTSTTSPTSVAVADPSVADTTSVTEPVVVGEKRKLDSEDESKCTIIPNTFKKLKSESNSCENVDISLLPEHDAIEIFLQDEWRSGLCKCPKCLEEYKKNKVEFLFAEEKTFEPEEDADAGKSLLEVGMEQLQRMDRIQAIESLRAFQTLSSDLKNFLEEFKKSGKVVTEEDVQAYFDAKRQERRQQQ